MPDLTRQNPRAIETRWPCPVCVGVMMEKKAVGDRSVAVTLDYCPRCGGLWFDRGEVGRVAQRHASVVQPLLIDKGVRVKPPCQGCGTPLDRNAESCGVCGRRNVLSCPVCDERMDRVDRDGLVLDVCKRCHGVWFDNAELTSIWRLKYAEALATRRSSARVGDAAAVGGDILLNAMFWTPDLMIYGGMAAGQAAGAAVEVVGDAAGGVFEAVMAIVAGLFE